MIGLWTYGCLWLKKEYPLEGLLGEWAAGLFIISPPITVICRNGNNNGSKILLSLVITRLFLFVFVPISSFNRHYYHIYDDNNIYCCPDIFVVKIYRNDWIEQNSYYSTRNIPIRNRLLGYWQKKTDTRNNKNDYSKKCVISSGKIKQSDN